MVTLDAGWYRDSYEAAERGRQEGTSDWQTLPRSALQTWATGCRRRCGPGEGEVGWSWAIKLIPFFCYTLFCLSLCLSFPLLLSPLFTYVPTFFLRSLPPSLLPPSLLSLSLTSWSHSTFDRPTQPPTIHTPWRSKRCLRWRKKEKMKISKTWETG